jgi:hypothetical protein
MSHTLDFRGRNKQIDEEKKKQMAAIEHIHKYKPDVHKAYLEEQALLREDLRNMDKSIDQALIDKAKQEEYLRQNPHLEEDCIENAKDCVTDALKWAFTRNSNNTIQYDSAKKNNGGKKSRKSHNSKKSKKSKKSHTSKKSKRSRR